MDSRHILRMEASRFSAAFQALYCNPAVFASFSSFHPISFARVLPFQSGDPVVDDHRLLYAEEAHLAAPSDDTRRRLIEAFFQCGLLTETDAANLKPVVDLFDADFFELMGIIYANARMFRCALRWHRELIQRLEREPNAGFRADYESVYASVGYCLYALGLFEEAIAWSKACIGPRQVADTVSRALIAYEAEPGGGALQVIERVGPRVRYVISAFDAAFTSQSTPRLKAAMKSVAPFHEVYMDWVTPEWKAPEPLVDGYPFQPEFDATTLVRHRMNLIFATCGRADVLKAKGYLEEAKRLLHEASMMEPGAQCLQERIRSLPT
jgi:tetratricopeptide (TPR) repeat protein